MHDNNYANNGFDIVKIQRRLKYALNNGVSTVILSGTGEALQNKSYLQELDLLFRDMGHPFPNIELQTTGVLLLKQTFGQTTYTDRYPNLEILQSLGISTISLSVSDIFNDKNNMEIIGVPTHARFDLEHLIGILKEKGFNIRLSLNMIKKYDQYRPEKIIERVKELDPDQVTFRKLYDGGSPCDEDVWVRNNRCDDNLLHKISQWIRKYGSKLYSLPYGPIAYSIEGMSTVLDNDCMGKEGDETLKYLILRENGKLYCRWDDKGSLIF
jgi:hypothetical protein